MKRSEPEGSRLLPMLALGIWMSASLGGLHAQTMADVAMLSGPDRIQELVAGAR
jgi:hypothetical protein